MVELSRGDSGDVVAACQSDVVWFLQLALGKGGVIFLATPR